MNTDPNDWKNPSDITDSLGPNHIADTASLLNKQTKLYQPVITLFFQKKIVPTTCSQQLPEYEVKTKNRFSVLIDEAISDMSTLDVINLSDRRVNEAEIRILNKGLHFCPTPISPDLGEIRHDLDKFHRSLRIQCWKNKNGTKTQPNIAGGPFNDIRSLKIKSESIWAAPPGPPNREHIISTNEIGLLYKPVVPTRSSIITHVERKCISDLANDTSIVIKKADKGGTIVIQNRRDYITEGEPQLSDGKFYAEPDHDPTTEHNIKIKTQLDAMFKSGEITKKTRDFLYLENPRTPKLYLLPKVHKKHFLRPIVAKGKSYIEDTTDFINKLSNIEDTNEESLLVSLDVNSLYTNIPNKEGAEATYEALETHRLTSEKPSNLSIAELLWLVLTLNNFRFNGTDHLQIGGTAMGTRLAPFFANLYMYHFEDKYVYPYHIQPSIWYRYIDDIFMVWNHAQYELTNFITHLNTSSENITFGSESSSSTLNFLDVTVNLVDNQISTDLYTKPTDRNTYLQYDSTHPKHCMNGLPYGQFLHIRRIRNRNTDFTAVENAYMVSLTSGLRFTGKFVFYESNHSPMSRQISFFSVRRQNPHILN